jgi:dienelactone hydrolase
MTPLGGALSKSTLGRATFVLDWIDPSARDFEELLAMTPNMLGAYGDWAASLLPKGPARLSYRRPEFNDLDAWRTRARAGLKERLLQPETGGVPKAEVLHALEYDGLAIEHLHWQLHYGPPTEALFLKPAGAKGRLPGVVALHDHGGRKFFGHRKIAQMSQDLHPMMREHRDNYYGGVSWANELAKKGYAVLVHDAVLFASRRVRYPDVSPVLTRGLKESQPESMAEVTAYNTFAGEHEDEVAKSLFCAGTTWPGVFTAEDQRALDYLCARPDVDADRVGCAGLSGGGLRTVFLGGLDPRIQCAICVGMMTTWKDYLLYKSHTHTWMCYVPGLPNELDYPEILGLRVPLPTLVQNDEQDSLFTMEGMREADVILGEVYKKAGAADRYRATFYPGKHKFDLPMQAEAFAWFDRWLRS